MSGFWNLPRLKRGVDLQLQTAYNDNDWPRVARLAAKRATISDRQYHEILKTAAEAQIDLPVSRYAAVVLATKMLKDGTVVADIESFDLLDWATKDVADDDFFITVMGPLRLRSVKSGKWSRAAMLLCFEACLRNWDLASAQQIAAFQDRSFKQERSFLFFNIAVTFLFATSDQCAKDKKALYSTLASRMALKANQDTAAAPKNPASQEEEVLVYYGILSAQGLLKDWQGLLTDESLGPIAQCRLGRKEPFLSSLRAFEKFGDWNSIYKLTKAAMTDPESTAETWKPSVLASDWALWQYFLKAARHVREANPEIVQEVSSRIEAASSDDAPAILRRTMILAKILACFELGDSSDSNPDAVKHMADMIQNLTVVARFEDLRPLVQRMAPADMHALLQAVSQPAESRKPIDVVLKQALIGKLRFLIATCPGSPASTQDFAAIITDACARLQNLSYPGRDSAVDEIAALFKDLDVSETKPIKAELSPDFAILIAVALIKLSGLTPGNVCFAKMSYLLQAIAVLENQLHITPKDHGVLILLVRLHTLIGSARRASEVWDVLDVKRTIVDSLAPLFLDRLCTVSPVLVSPTILASHKITRTVLSYYENVLSTNMPKSVVQAIHAKSYSSLIQIPEYIASLKTSSTRAMGYLERRRATRAFTGKPDDWTLADVPVYSETVNFGPFPTLESSTARPIYETLSLGPPPSNERTQLAVLGEKLFSILAFKPPTMYKPSAAAITAEETYVTEALTRLANSFGRYLTAADLSVKLTPAEFTYYHTLALLTHFTLSMCPPTPGAVHKPTVDAVIGSLTDLTNVISTRLSDSPDSATKALAFFSSLHDLWHLRDTACAVRVCLDYITLFNSRQKPARPPPKDDAAHMKALAAAAAAASAQAKTWVALAKKAVGEAGFERKIAEVAFGAVDGGVTETVRKAADIEGTSAANWAKKIVESWRENIAGWETIKWE
ncbi:hypothetical protein TD95_000243 [Thielaviopsis punctulata]|uniref:Uncharacterized protein n=1 Tax=Thielaviopsis punctulata TaxID=72032 RepID=A0A0F4ZDP3_9PEZI|nr:hypothetical protein TD95_000243 [Thielaviopsis punctulata]